jgi:hypothetical protein
MLDERRREFIVLVGAAGLLLAAKVRRARAAAGDAGDRVAAERECSPDERPFNALTEFRRGVNTRINRHLDLVTGCAAVVKQTSQVIA